MAKKERLYLRLYRIHDPDLMLLYHNPNFGFGKALKAAIRAYASKEPFFMLPPPAVEFDDNWTSCMVRVMLDTELDADIIDFLNEVKPRKINTTVKAILRGAIIGTYAYGEIKGKEYGDYNRALIEKLCLLGAIPEEYVHEYAPRNNGVASKQKAVIKERKKLLKKKEEKDTDEKEPKKRTKDANTKSTKAAKPKVNRHNIKKSDKKAKEALYEERFEDEVKEPEFTTEDTFNEDIKLDIEKGKTNEETNGTDGGNDFFAQLGSMLVN